MKYQLLKAREQLLSNHWLTPMLITLAFAVAVFILLWVDVALLSTYSIRPAMMFQAGTAKLVLSTVATSIMTVTGVVFSITVLILSIASSQFGPRLIPNFIRQGKTQLVLGHFIGTFVYCLISLCFIDVNPIPFVTVSVGVVLGIFSCLILIYFIHYVCKAIQVETILNRLATNIKSTVDSEHVDKVKEDSMDLTQAFETLKGKKAKIINCSTNGFIQYIDYSAILDLAQQHNFVAHILHQPGTYMITGLPFMELYFDTEMSDSDSVVEQVYRCIRMDDHRTDVQDIEFLFEQVSEIAVRALSPGVNNPYTAILCLNVTAECIAYLNEHYLPTQVWCNDNKEVKLIVKYPDYNGIINKSFDRLRQQAKDDVSVAIKMTQMIFQLTQLELKPEIMRALQKHAQLIYNDSMSTDLNPLDREDIRTSYNAILEK